MPSFLLHESVFAWAVQLLAIALLLSTPALADNTFDQPVRTQVVDLGPSPYCISPACRIILTCYSYPNFIVKQIDSGQKGAEVLAIVPIRKRATPSCTDKAVEGETNIKDWSGYFKGVKGTLVFFDGDDGYNGGIPFGVYDSRTGMRVFEDSVAHDGRPVVRHSNEPSPFKNMRVSRDEKGTVFLTYIRAVPTECDLNTEGSSCWNTVRAKFGLIQSHPPACKGYKNISTRVESVLAYPVLVSLSSPPVVKALNGPIKCWPVD